jgi:VIT1/CCC1 family predicted Fe2+/Mn2+ transporter
MGWEVSHLYWHRGVGAFIYYRRVVENQKNRILGEIIKVSEKIGAAKEKVEKLKSAITETQFSKALDMAKDSIPESLLINGHSPILLLHSALSEGVHALTDEQCLDLAGSVRIVFGELSERLSQALKDEAELTKALSKLMNKKKS